MESKKQAALNILNSSAVHGCVSFTTLGGFAGSDAVAAGAGAGAAVGTVAGPAGSGVGAAVGGGIGGVTGLLWSPITQGAEFALSNFGVTPLVVDVTGIDDYEFFSIGGQVPGCIESFVEWAMVISEECKKRGL